MNDRSRLDGARPEAVFGEELDGFFEGAAAGELRLQQCSACGAFRFPPKPVCGSCRSAKWEWAAVSGRGTVYSFVVVHQSANPAYAERVPYDVVLVEPDEAPGVRIIGNTVGCALEDLAVGMPVEVAFETTGTHDVAVFRPVPDP